MDIAFIPQKVIPQKSYRKIKIILRYASITQAYLNFPTWYRK